MKEDAMRQEKVYIGLVGEGERGSLDEPYAIAFRRTKDQETSVGDFGEAFGFAQREVPDGLTIWKHHWALVGEMGKLGYEAVPSESSYGDY
jgi:hypothetical protein